MVYYLIVYTVLLVKFPKKKCLAPHQQNLDPPLTRGSDIVATRLWSI